MPQRIQRSRAKGYRMPPGAVYVGRGTIWGNPFTVAGAREAGYVGTDTELRAMCAREYRDWLSGNDSCHQDRYWPGGGGRSYDRIEVRARLHELAGRDLACWCSTEPCHADVLLEAANHPTARVS